MSKIPNLNIDIDFSQPNWAQQIRTCIRKRLSEKPRGVTEERVAAATARISTNRNIDDIDPKLIEAIKKNKQFMRYRLILELEGIIL